ncbi:hypothetical protein B0A55_00811 [Friedmanniomyces simplex]|uniref:DNL-type domain-containing protein n=1 Tax=Friedmanniomyces simplex TaxID=329884 RepID=A0A4U0XZL2_9PEZI|nr:hypothetical protein B0A55_00811 [Friedmanniomyces simplex]
MNSASSVIQRVSRQVLKSHHAPFRIPQRPFHLARPSPSPSRLSNQFAGTRIATQLRRQSTAAPTRAPNPLTDAEVQQTAAQDADEIAARKAQEPAYEMHFTCRKCMHRSAHRITKQAYHFGTTLVTCPDCKGRHLISDHLKIFSDKSITVEDLLREKGEFLRKGRLGEDGDIEFYDERGKPGT